MSRFALAVPLIFAVSAQAQTAYFAAIDDLPLPPGYAEADGAAVFAAAEGRIVLAYAEGELSGDAVRDFYYEALPQLGWAVSPQPDGALEFQRGRERLSFTLERREGLARLRARLFVAPAAMNAD